jgi:hypothetical protein
MHFRNTLLILAIASSVLMTIKANAQMNMMGGSGYYGGAQNCEMGGAGALSKEDKEAALQDKARYKYLEKKLGQLDKELKAMGREQGVRGDADEIIEHVNGRLNKVKRALGDPTLFGIFQKSYTKEWSCEVTGEGKRESSYDLECGPKRSVCDVFAPSKSQAAIDGLLITLGNQIDTAAPYSCDEVIKLTDLPPTFIAKCPAGTTKSVAQLEADLAQFVSVPVSESGAEQNEKYAGICRRPELICRPGNLGSREQVEACTKALGEITPDLAQKTKEYNYVLQELEAVAENLGPVDFYTEGSYCFECQQAGNRRFVDDRSGFRKTFDTMMPILGGAAAAYGGYRLNNEAIDRATNLGFTTNPAPSFLSYGYPMIMNGIYGGIASGIGAGAFQCGNTMGGYFAGGHNGMNGPFGMQGMMGQQGAFGYPFGQSPYGQNGYGGGPYMPGLVGGYGAGPWGVGGQLGYGVGIPQILGMPGGGGMGFQGVPGFGGAGFAGGAGFQGVPGFGGAGFAGGAGFQGVPGFGGAGFAGGAGFQGVPGFGGAGYAGLYSVPGGMGIAGYAGLAGYAGMGNIGYAGGVGYAGIPGAAGIAGYAGIAGGLYGVAGLQGSIGSSLGLQYQQQLIQQQMQQYQQQMSMLQQYQEYEINRQRTRSQLQQQLQQLQLQLYQLEAGGGVGIGGIGSGVGTPYIPQPTGTFNPGTNPAR